jgi:3-hydroxyanthranilate 3,4-dioxygenase
MNSKMDRNELNVINTAKWIEENKDKFKPPVCNKLMHNNQLTIMFVGGPNVRDDYHIEEGEELFYQIKGDISLKILENNQHKEIFIKEGELFLLPARIPHSPQRPENTIGLVIERFRHEDEIDGVRWFVPGSSVPLYEKWFYCTDLGAQLAPVIRQYFASDEYKTKVPNDNVLQKLPFDLNTLQIDSDLHGPFRLQDRIQNNTFNLTQSFMKMQFVVNILGKGDYKIENFDQKGYDIWLWQLEGQSVVDVGIENKLSLIEKDSLLIPANYCKGLDISVSTGFLLQVIQDPRLK